MGYCIKYLLVDVMDCISAGEDDGRHNNMRDPSQFLLLKQADKELAAGY